MALLVLMDYLPYLVGIGAVVILALAIWIVCCCCNCRRQRKEKITDVELQSDTPKYHVDTTDARDTQSPSVWNPTLDLHGKKLKEAMQATRTFITTSKKGK
ncbi:unnamed protein product [Lymnaea stagnalis]|uniref:Uncharacterized protein n=1 Tax=Lymnaea stagnalis TaxID=6523 RepID=A0AAV2ICP0_LYMST